MIAKRRHTIFVLRTLPAIFAVIAACRCASVGMLRAPTAQSFVVPAAQPLDVPFIPQCYTKWCWAASGQMIMKFLGENVLQCDQADSSPPTGHSQCCVPCHQDPPLACRRDGEPDFNRYGFEYQVEDGPSGLDEARITKELDSGRPLGYYSHLISDGGGHIVVLYGYRRSPSLYLYVRDPLDHSVAGLSYDEYVGGPGHSYEHCRTYYGLRRAQNPAPIRAKACPPLSPPPLESTAVRSSLSGLNTPDTERIYKLMRDAERDIASVAAIKQEALTSFIDLASHGLLQTSREDKIPSNLVNARLAEVLPRYSVRLDELETFSKGKSATALLTENHDLVYLIRIDEVPVSTVTLHRNNSAWQVASYGTTMIARELDDALKTTPPETVTTFRFLVHGPDLGVMFLGYADHEDVNLTAVTTNGMLDVPIHAKLPVVDMFMKLRTAAIEFTSPPQ